MKSYLSYSLDDAVRYRASSGGFCKEFLRFCIETKVVDKAILTILGDGNECLVPRTIVTDDIKKIMSAKSNSIYDRTNPLSVLKKLNSDESYIFVGLPCHILPMKKYCSAKNVKVITISLFCNHTSRSYYKSVLNDVGLTESDVRHFEYRGSGWPGSIRIVTDVGEIKLDYVDWWNKYSKNYLDMLPKCKKCIKSISNDADICVGDAWIQRVLNRDKNGTNMVVTMNSVADNFVIGCFEKKYIHLEPLSYSEFDAQNNASIKIKTNRKNK